jgi:tetratricopeptide (TPR) repeat protein
MDTADYYRVLGLKPGASVEEIKAAYRDLAKRWHPDLHQDPQLKQQAEVELKKINVAYDYLQNLSDYGGDAATNAPAKAATTTAPTSSKTGRVVSKPNSAAGFYELGLEQVRQKEYLDALDSFNQAIKLNSNYGDAYLQRAGVCNELGYYHRAASDLKNAKRLGAKQAQAKKRQTPQASSTTPAPEDRPLATDWQLAYHFVAHKAAVKMLALNPNQSMLITAGADDRILLWDLHGQQLLKTLKHNDIRQFTLYPQGQQLVTTNLTGALQGWQLPSGERLPLKFNHNGGVYQLQFSPDGQYLFTLGKDGTVKVWHWQFQQLHLVFKEATYTALACSDDSQTLFLGDSVGQVHQYQLNDGKKLYTLLALPSHKSVSGLTLAPDGRTLAIYSLYEQAVHLWDWETGKLLQVLKGHSRPPVSVQFCPNGKLLASSSPDRTINVWDVATGTVSQTLEVLDFTDSAYTLAFSADGNSLYSGWQNGSVRIWQYRP